MSFDKNVFINCPFDKRYRRLLHPLIFTCIYCRLQPTLAKLADSGTTRVNQIVSLIKKSKYSIHDLSRMKSSTVQELSRFNMPFELGLDLGIRQSGSAQLQSKQCLVLDIEKYRYQAAISDMAGNDIACYGKRNQIQGIIRVVRDWFTHIITPSQPSATKIYLEYIEFVSDLQSKLQSLHFSLNDIRNLTNSEYITYVEEWVSNR